MSDAPDQSAVVVLEPVAWRWRYDDDGLTNWYFSTSEPGTRNGRPLTPPVEVQPLYAAAPKPTLSGDVEPLLERARKSILHPGCDNWRALRDLKALVAALSPTLPGVE